MGMRRVNYWPEHLVCGDVVRYKGIRCIVASQERVKKFVDQIPKGHVPIMYLYGALCGNMVFTAPLDELSRE